MKRIIVLAALAALVTAGAATPAAGACPCSANVSITDIPGDVYVLKVTDPAGEGFRVLDGSRMRAHGDYADARPNAAVSFAWTNLDESGGIILYRDAFVDSSTRAEVLTDLPIGQEVRLDEAPGGGYSSASVRNTFGSDVDFAGAEWYFVLAVPAAATMDVDVSLAFDRPVVVGPDAVATSGVLAAADDFDGAANVLTAGHAVSALVGVDALAPPGTRGFAVVGPPTPSQGVGHFGVDGPGDADRMELVVDTQWTTSIQMMAGPPGDYRLVVNAQARTGDNPFRGMYGVFFAAPMPL